MASLTTKLGAVFVQTAGPNTQPQFVGCVDADTITEPGGDIDQLIRCFRPDGAGWTVRGATVKPPDPVTTTLTTYTEGIQNALERLKSSNATLFINQREGGVANTFGNYVRSWVLGGVYVGQKTGSDLVNKDTDTPSMMAFAISALPPVYRAFQRTVSRKSTTEAGGIMDVAFTGSGNDLCKYGFLACKFVTSASADVLYTQDSGTTWTIGSTDPFAVSETISSVVCFQIGRSTVRALAALGTTRAGGPLAIAYSDDYGTTWTSVSVGSTNAQFVQNHNGLFAYDPYNIWAVAGAGYIYKSTDSGLSWTTQDAGVTTVQNLHSVHFATDKVGAVGGAAGAIAVTQDGGTTWTLKTAPASTILNTLWVIDSNNIWAGGSNGNLYYTTDGGTTWSARSFTGSGAGQVRSIVFAPGSNLMGTLVINSASPVGTVLTTIDGGYTWEAWTTPTNSGLNGAFICDENNSWIVGEVNGGTGVILKVAPKQ